MSKLSARYSPYRTLRQDVPTIVFLCCMAALLLFGFALSNIGKPAHIADLDGGAQTVIWNDGDLALFRADDGTRRLVHVSMLGLKSGSRYVVEHRLAPGGGRFGHTEFWLRSLTT